MSHHGGPEPSDTDRQRGHRGHGRWMMIACCVPMLVIAVVLVATGAGGGFLLVALVCTALMATMMIGMGSGHDGEDRDGS